LKRKESLMLLNNQIVQQTNTPDVIVSDIMDSTEFITITDLNGNKVIITLPISIYQLINSIKAFKSKPILEANEYYLWRHFSAYAPQTLKKSFNDTSYNEKSKSPCPSRADEHCYFVGVGIVLDDNGT